MRETTRSLGMYFMLCGGLGLLGGGIAGFSALSASGPLDLGHVFVAIVLGIYVLISAAYLYIGVNLGRLLAEKPRIPLQFTVLSLIFSGLTFSIFGFLINLYIWYQLKRLAREADVKLEQQTLE